MTQIRNRILMSAVLLSGLLVTTSLSAAQSSDENKIVTTQHQVRVEGKILKYTASAGRLPILNNETGEVHGWMFFTAYTLDAPGTTTKRPLTFLWNGGPGSSSSLVHLLGFGPRRLQPDGTAVDNSATWLDTSDLVFVDPIGTGYSRPTQAEYGPEFYQAAGDAESVAEFIRVYRNRFEAWEAPVFLAGESYGVTRAAAVADVLQRRGINVNGVILMGLVLPLGQLSSDQRVAFAVPNYTAAAHANRKLEPPLQADLQTALKQSEEWAESTYFTALARRDTLNDTERQRILTQLARFSGVPVQKLDPKSLTLSMDAFSKLLLADEGKVVGRYDSRLVGPLDPGEKLYDPTKDPSLIDIISDIGVIRYFRNELSYRNDLKYQGPFGGGYPPATSFRGDWMSVKWSRAQAQNSGTSGRPANTSAAATPPVQPLRRAMIANPELRVFVACGYYDLVCNYTANNYLATHLDQQIPRNVTARAYGGGHALYTDATARMNFKQDIVKFIQGAISSTKNSTAGSRVENGRKYGN